MSDEIDLEVEEELRRAAATGIDPTALNEEFVRLPGDLAYWNDRYSDAYEAYLDAKRRLEIGEEELRESLRGVAEDKKWNLPTVRAVIVSNKTYQLLREAADKADSLKVRAAGVVKAIEAKKDMLISLGAHIRKEMQSQVTIKKW